MVQRTRALLYVVCAFAIGSIGCGKDVVTGADALARLNNVCVTQVLGTVSTNTVQFRPFFANNTPDNATGSFRMVMTVAVPTGSATTPTPYLELSPTTPYPAHGGYTLDPPPITLGYRQGGVYNIDVQVWIPGVTGGWDGTACHHLTTTYTAP